LPVANNVLEAVLIEKAGFKCFGIGGFGISASQYGYLDNGHIGLKQIAQAVATITPVVNIPCLVDADTGYGGPQKVIHTIKTIKRAGAAAIFIEDQVWPKKCGHLNGKKVIPINKMKLKIKAALKARQDKNLVIMARTDSGQTHGINKAISRAISYYQTGADIVWVEAPQTIKEIKLISQKLKNIPKMINLIEGGKTPLMSQKQLKNLGFNLISYPLTTLLSNVKITQQVLKNLKQKGTTKNILTKLYLFKDLRKILKS